MNRTHHVSDRHCRTSVVLGALICAVALFVYAAPAIWAQERALPDEQKAYRAAPTKAPTVQMPAEKMKAEKAALQAIESEQIEQAAPTRESMTGTGGSRSIGKQVVPAPASEGISRGRAGIAPAPSRVVPVPRDEPRARVVQVRRMPRFHTSIWTDRSSYRPGEAIEIYFRATRDAYVYVFDTEPSGVTRQIFPNFYDRDNFVEANVTYGIPNRGYDLVVEGPSGRESLQIVAVAQRFSIFSTYERFDRSDPYPVRDGGSRRLMEGIQREGAVRYGRASGDVGVSRIGLRPAAVVVNPRYPAPTATATDETSFLVERARRGKGVLRVTSEPSRARIYVDGRNTGNKTSEDYTLSYGTYEVTVEKEGYYPETETVTIDDDKTTVRFNLERIGSRRRGR